MEPVTQSTRLVLVSACILALVGFSAVASAQPPDGYYSSVDPSDAATLRETLHAVIDDHQRYPYSSSQVDAWDIMNLADEDGSDPSRVIDVYRNASHRKTSDGDGAYDRGHIWPSSFGFPEDDGVSNYPYTDVHNLFASDANTQAQRSDGLIRSCSGSCLKQARRPNEGRGVLGSVDSHDADGMSSDVYEGTREIWNGRKGDVARAILYMDVRYEGGVHGVTGDMEPDLRLTDDESLIERYRTGTNEPVAYMGMLSTLLSWHRQDPVDHRELWRNEMVFSFQGNRNPFIDHPEWVACLYENQCVGSRFSGFTPILDFSNLGMTSFSNQDTNNGSVAIEGNGSTYFLQGNRWRRSSTKFQITPSTILEFEFSSSAQGEIHGIGFDENDTLSSSRIFKLHGTQNWGVSNFDNYSGSGAWVTYTIPVGLFYTGNAMFLVLVNDKDSGPATNTSRFRNVKVFEP